MVCFKHEFREFNKSDYNCYAGAHLLPNHSKPKIYGVETKDDVGVDIILSGDGAGSTLICIETELGSYLLSLPGYNACHGAIADSIIDYFEDYEVTKEALDGIVSDYEFTKIL